MRISNYARQSENKEISFQLLLGSMGSESAKAILGSCSLSIRQEKKLTTKNVIIQELMTRHKSTVAEYLSKNYEWVRILFSRVLLPM